MKARFNPQVIRETPVLLLAAVALGLAYNDSSPLGISFSTPAAPAGLRTEKPVDPPDALPAEKSDPAIQNDTLTAVIVANGQDNPGLAARRLPASLPWAEVKSLLAKKAVVLLDGREPSAYAVGHIPGAISLPLQTLADQIGSFTAKYPPNQPLVVYCASIHCPISQAEAAALTEKYGYLDVREMPGGYAEWRVNEPAATPATGASP